MKREETGARDAPDLRETYSLYCDPSYAVIGDDGKTLLLDTNPDDLHNYTDYAAYLAIQNVNGSLRIPDSVIERMNRMSQQDGEQTYTDGDFRVTWAYHPDRGLEVQYSVSAQKKPGAAPAPDLRKLFSDFCDASYASVSEDGSVLRIDTNPEDIDQQTDYAAMLAMMSVNEALGLPASLMSRFEMTLPEDGEQTFQNGEVTVTWTFSSEKGLEVAYRLAGQPAGNEGSGQPRKS